LSEDGISLKVKHVERNKTDTILAYVNIVQHKL